MQEVKIMSTRDGQDMPSICACLQLRRAGRRVTQMYDRFLRPSGIRSTQFGLLMHIGAGGDRSITEIGDALCLDQTTATRNIDILVKQGLVTLEPHPEDVRKKRARLTPTGRAKRDEALPLWRAAQEAFRAALGEDDFVGLLDALQDVVEAIP